MSAGTTVPNDGPNRLASMRSGATLMLRCPAMPTLSPWRKSSRAPRHRSSFKSSYMGDYSSGTLIGSNSNTLAGPPYQLDTPAGATSGFQVRVDCQKVSAASVAHLEPFYPKEAAGWLQVLSVTHLRCGLGADRPDVLLLRLRAWRRIENRGKSSAGFSVL